MCVFVCLLNDRCVFHEPISVCLNACVCVAVHCKNKERQKGKETFAKMY